jgi:methylmalonyl-CoA mutase N-terminal domain/subunit
VRAFRAARDGARAEAALRALRDAAARAAPAAPADRTPSPEGNLVDLILAAVKADATVGEIADALRQEFGEYDNFPR